MIQLKLTLDKRRIKKDNTYPLVYRIGANRKSFYLSTGASILEKFWDDKRQQIKLKSKELEMLASRLRSKEIQLLQKIQEYESGYSSVCIAHLKNHLLGNTPKRVTIIDFWHQEIARQTSAKKYGNARNYKSALHGLLKHCESLDMEFSQLNYPQLEKWEIRMRENGVSVNSISVYYRALRSIYNKAINYDYANLNDYPFRKYRIKKSPTLPKVLSLAELREFMSFNPPKESVLYIPWCIGKLIFLLRGINFTDLIQLRQDDVVDNRIIYKRQKTNKIYSLSYLPQIKHIIDELNSDTDLLVPLLSAEDIEMGSALPYIISQRLKVTNKHLREIGRQLKTTAPISSYVFRYSYANACKELGYSKDLIAEALGHQYGNPTTSIYLNPYDNGLLDEMNLKIIAAVGC